jgi:signal peptidase II
MKRATRKKAPRVAVAKKQLPKSRFWPWGIVIFSVLLFIDQYTKNVIITTMQAHQSVKVFPGLWFTYVQNRGITWGLLQGANDIMLWLSIAAFGLLIFFYDRFETTMEKICYTLILVGLWGNLLDRGIHGFVIDFIDVRWFYVFNIADAAISVAIVVLILEQIRKSRNA